VTGSLLCPDAFLSPLEIDAAVTTALAEDLGRAGDVTSTATIPADARGRAIVVARQPGVIAGLPLVETVFRKLAPDIDITAHVRDGAGVVAGGLVTEASGGITLDTVGTIAESGVDYVSSGAITHSAPNLDVALDIAI